PRLRLRLSPGRIPRRRPQQAVAGGDGQTRRGAGGRDARRPHHLERPRPRHGAVLDTERRVGGSVMDSLPWKLATWLIPLIIAIVFHEVSHGLVANALGDPTAWQRGRLIFNPLRHIDPFGTVLLPMLLAVTGAPVFGWA